MLHIPRFRVEGSRGSQARPGFARRSGALLSWVRTRVAVTAVLMVLGCGGEFGAPVPEEMPAPTRLTLAVAAGQVDLEWVDNSDSEDSFRIQRRTGEGDFALLASVGADATTYEDTAVAEDTQYTYRVAACNADGCSGFSNEARAATTPRPPSGLEATVQADGSIALFWTDNSLTETEFRIWRAHGIGGFAMVATTAADEKGYIDADVVLDTEYAYQVAACHPQACSAPSDIASAVTVPAAPTGDSATAVSNTRIDIHWADHSATEDSFRVERRTASTAFTEIVSTGPGVTLYADTGLQPGTTYRYRIRACNSGGCSPYSDTLTATTGTLPAPAAPSALVATLSGDGAAVSLVWVDNSDDETGFRLWRSLDGATLAQRATIGADTTTFVDRDIEDDGLYAYRVDACNAAGCSGFSNEASVVTRPLAPSGLTATPAVARIDLSWVDNSDTEEEVEIERAVGGGAFVNLSAVGPDATAYADGGVEDDTRYSYRVRACNSTGCSNFSSTVTTTTRPLPASGLTAQAVSASEIDLAWIDGSATESEFRVERRAGMAPFASVGSTAADATTFADAGLVSGTTYDYRITACNAGGCAAPSNEASATTDSGSGSEPAFPLRVSSDRHWLEYADGSTFYVNGDAAWSIMVELTRAEVTTYLEDRAAKGVNLIMVNLIEHLYSDNSPPWENAYGEVPFNSTLAGGEFDFSDPNEAYWDHVDWIMSEAERLHIVVFAIMAYIGFEHGDDGWSGAVAANGTSRMAVYGTFLANRYADQPNIIFVVGGDYGPIFGGSDLTAEYAALANAIKAENTGHLVAAHAEDGQSGRDAYGTSYIDFDTVYGPYGAWLDQLHRLIRRSYQATSPTLPTLMIEAAYGNEHSSTDLYLRKQMWQSVLGGAIGHIYGNSPTWYFGEDASHPANSFADQGGLDWHDQLDSFGASYLPFVARLQAARDLDGMTPDYDHVYVTAGYGTEGTDYAPAMGSQRVLVAYTPGRALTVDRSRFVTATFNIRWYNVRNGTTVSVGSRTFGTGSETFTPPDSSDWVLLLDDQSLGLGAP